MLSEEEIFEAIAPFYAERHIARAAIEVSIDEYRAVESAACEERDARIAELEAFIAKGEQLLFGTSERIAELEQQLQAYEKHGVTCQTFRHFVSEPCAECNSPGRCAIKEQT